MDNKLTHDSSSLIVKSTMEKKEFCKVFKL